MPAIYLFQRRTLLGGDDLQPAAVATMTLRGCQVVGGLGPIVAHIVTASLQRGGFFRYILYDSPHDNNNGSDNSNILYSDDDYDIACRHSHMFALILCCYALGSFLYTVASIGIEARLAHVSSLGCPTQTHPRNDKVTQLLEWKLVPLTVVQFLVWTAGMSSLGYAATYYHCELNASNHTTKTNTEINSYFARASSATTQNKAVLLWLGLALLLLTQALEIFLSCLYLFHLCQQPVEVAHTVTGTGTSTRHYHNLPRHNIISSSSQDALFARSNTASPPPHELVEEMWASRCAAACQCLSVSSCYIFGGRDLMQFHADNGTTTLSPFGDVARALADYLETRGVLDVVPSDIVAGFIVLQQLQRQRVYQARRRVLEQSSQVWMATSLSTSSSGIVAPDEEDVLISLDNTASSPPGSKSSLNGSSPSLLRRISPSTSRVAVTATADASPASVHTSPNATRSPTATTTRTNNNTIIAAAPQSIYRLDVGGQAERMQRAVLSRNNPLDVQALEEGARYAKFALAIYTWPLYLYVHPVTGAFRLLAHGMGSPCCFCGKNKKSSMVLPDDNNLHTVEDGTAVPLPLPLSFSGDEDSRGCETRVEGEDFLEIHKSALLLTAGLKESELVYVQLRSSFRENPYCILLDHEWRSVVVSIRGTFSLEDCVTDVLIEPESLAELGDEFGFDGSKQYCHGGVLACVRNVFRDLQRHRYLECLLLGHDALYPDYTLRLVGHSLGAATATILSYMLRPTFPSVRCVNYSPPGCSLTWEMAVNCKDWCTSHVLDSDIVPRLSLVSMERLRDEILELIARIKVPKYQIAKRVVVSSGGGVCNETADDDAASSTSFLHDILYHPDEVPRTEYSAQLERFKTIQEERRSFRGAARSISLYPPGKMLHIIKTGEQKTCCTSCVKCLTCCTSNLGFQYTPVWIENDDLNEIVVTPTMGTDHFPNRMQMMLEKVAADYVH